MGEFPGDRSDMFLGRLRDISRLAAEQGLSHETAIDPARHRSSPTDQVTTRRDFFRYSNRQFMVLISTLSLCFAVNRNNNIDDLIFVLGYIMNPTILWISLTFVALFFIVRAIRKSTGDTTAR